MDNSEFYDIIDNRVGQLMNEFDDCSELKRKNTDETKRSYMFMLWFLERYLPGKRLPDIKKHIVDGSFDNSCDLIFDNVDSSGERIFYVVQSKWFKKSNINKSNRIAKEIKACLEDYKAMLFNDIPPFGNNEGFKEKYEKLKRHQQANGKIRILFIILCRKPADIDNYLRTFSSDLLSVEIMDINRLRLDYIEFELKEIKTFNPLEIPYAPNGKINLYIEESNYIKIEKPYRSYIFLIRPSMLFELVDRFGFSLFSKNLRNPLTKSTCNSNIEKTLKEFPQNFWYYNNGITVITNEVKPFYPNSKLVTIENLQIINGAQTVYSIYRAYCDLNEEDRRRIDAEALLTLRLIESRESRFNFNVTRYTNSQNSIVSRDFHANDEIQLKLQRDFSMYTDILYETRRGEFKSRKDSKVISNQALGQTYLAYSLQEPLLAKTAKSRIFISQLEDDEGLYERVFNEFTSYEEMLASYYLYNYIEKARKESTGRENYNSIRYASFELLALFSYLFNTINKDNLQKAKGVLIYQCKSTECNLIKAFYELAVEILGEFLKSYMDGSGSTPYSVFFKRVNTYGDLKNYAKAYIARMADETLEKLRTF